MIQNKLLGLIRLVRPLNSLMTGFAVLVGEFLAYRALYFYPSILGFITAFTITGASMVINDYWDRFLDEINAPSRPIPSGLVSVKLALFYALLLILIGISSALFTNSHSFLIAIFSLSISLIYSYRGKKLGLIGNFMVGFCIAIPLFYGGTVYDGVNFGFQGMKSLIIFDFMVFLAITAREINKGIADIEGDKVKGINTIAVIYGSKVAAVLASVFYLAAVTLSLIPWFLSLTSFMYLPLVTIADVGFIISSFILLRDNTKKNAIKVKRIVLIWMFFGLFAFISGGIS